MADETADVELRELTAEIVSAYVARNTLDAETLPDLIHQVYETMSSLGKVEAVPEKPVPAVPLKKSVFPDYIVCLEDGKKLKMLKRHLKTAYNMTPEEYRERWGLPHDYPMVAPSYASHRSKLARKIGLGTKDRGADQA
ncbi:MucR family transcriptional regulator [Gluconacetobacter entanii]|uniref:MucR family transcriptional regulator n=1 Tax=Gluconacetobacter entanii TaxID=108528 RepID=A0A318QCC5_9PROT|nr:MucR family transcriptional regulator [Gluconacetobacter entanii]MBE7620559.1 MucR family transcriptional regulator [Komagataeibacter sp. FXV2]MCE2579168.1 MucR family transcriptional regulator [Komagataeibacter sp. FNDCR1]PYD63637.1 MucR family transcriptional regulator [Gluconacetobacter entanii]